MGCNNCSTSKGNVLVKESYLIKQNYLSEFKTEAEKAKARHNLGIKTKKDSKEVAYFNNKLPLIENVQEALDLLIDSMSYVRPSDWDVQFTVSDSQAYLGTTKTVTWNYSVIPKPEFTLIINIDGNNTLELQGSITKTVLSNTTVRISVDTGDVDYHGNKPQPYTKEIGITFIKPCVYWTSDNESFTGIPTEVSLLQSGKEVNCGEDNLYIYIAVLQSNINNVKIKTPDTEVYDKGFIEISQDEILTAGSIPQQTSDVYGYYVYRTGEMLKGSWNVKY